MSDFRCTVQDSNKFTGTYNSVQVILGSVYDQYLTHAASYATVIGGPNGTEFKTYTEEGTELPSVLMNKDAAKALMLGLMEYFGEYRGDIALLRRDYAEERKRVDRFIDFLVKDKNAAAPS